MNFLKQRRVSVVGPATSLSRPASQRLTCVCVCLVAVFIVIPAKPAPAVPAVDERSVQMLVDMGYPAARARTALVATKGNVDAAVERLLSEPEEPPTAAVAATSEAAVAAPAAASCSAVPAADPLLPLRNHPKINQLRKLVQGNPDTIPIVWQQIGKTSPALLEIINTHRDAFIALLKEPLVEAPVERPAVVYVVSFLCFSSLSLSFL